MSATLDRIRKLLSLASNAAAAPNEADMARALADNLMKASGLTEADIGDSGVNPVSTVAREYGMKQTGRWVGVLAVATSRVVGCSVYRDACTGKVVWVGTADMREAAKEMHAWLVRQVTRLGESARKSAPQGPGRRAWLNAYRQGVATAVAEKVREAVAARPVASVEGRALAVQDEVKLAIKRCMPATTPPRRARVDASGFAAGKVDGSSVEFRRGMATTDKTRMLGGAA